MHLVGMEVDEYEIFLIETDGFVLDEENVEWFNFCPHCGVKLEKGEINA